MDSKLKKKKLKLYRAAVETPTQVRYIDNYWGYSKTVVKKELESNGLKVHVIEVQNKFAKALEIFNIEHEYIGK